MLYAIILHYKRNWQGDWQCQPLIFLFRKSSLLLAFYFYFYIHGLQRVLAVSDSFHSANTLPLAKRMLFTMSMMLGIGYSPMRRIENSMAEMRWYIRLYWAVSSVMSHLLRALAVRSMSMSSGLKNSVSMRCSIASNLARVSWYRSQKSPLFRRKKGVEVIDLKA